MKGIAMGLGVISYLVNIEQAKGCSIFQEIELKWRVCGIDNLQGAFHNAQGSFILGRIEKSVPGAVFEY